MKRAFLGTDEDLLAGEWLRYPLSIEADSTLDPAHTRDPSGCTAVAALVTSDNKIYVVCAVKMIQCHLLKKLNIG